MLAKKNHLNVHVYVKLNFFLFVLASVFFCCFFFVKCYMKKDIKFNYFVDMFVLFVCGMSFFIARNRFGMYFLCWEMLGCSSFLLICFYKNWQTISNSIIGMFCNRFGDLFLLVLMCSILNRIRINYSINIRFFVVLSVIAFTKGAQFPLSCWLPAAISAPTPVSALVHSTTLVTAGILVFMKCVLTLHFNTRNVLVAFSQVRIRIGSVMACMENDFKRIVAFSTLRQIRFLTLIISTRIMYLVMFCLLMHAYFKRMVFFSVGNVMHNNIYLQDKRFLFVLVPHCNMIIVMLALSSMRGLLFLSGFFRKEVFLEKILHKNNTILLFGWTSVLSLTRIYASKMLMVMFILGKQKILFVRNSVFILGNMIMTFVLTQETFQWQKNNALLFCDGIC